MTNAIIGYVLTVLFAFIGLHVYRIWYLNHHTDGTIKIDRSNPEKDVYRLEIDDLDNLSKKKRVILKIDPNADLSQQ